MCIFQASSKPVHLFFIWKDKLKNKNLKESSKESYRTKGKKKKKQLKRAYYKYVMSTRKSNLVICDLNVGFCKRAAVNRFDFHFHVFKRQCYEIT